MEWKHSKIQGGGDKWRLTAEDGVVLATIIRQPLTTYRVFLRSELGGGVRDERTSRGVEVFLRSVLGPDVPLMPAVERLAV